MKLRNKKTGEIGQIGYVATNDGQIIVEDISEEEYPYSVICSYKTLSELSEEWEDVEYINVTNIPLIKDEKIRKAVRAWAEAVNTYACKYDEFWKEFRFNNCNICFKGKLEAICSELKHGEHYTIAELCGEEE